MHVILRYWRGWTTSQNADAYQKIVSEQVLPGIAAPSSPATTAHICFDVILTMKSSSQP